MLKIGFLGFGTHAERLNRCLKESLDDFDLVCYHPTKQDSQTTNKFESFCDCDVFFITSPNETHFGYIEKLLEKTNSKIFCEKPPCTSSKELQKLLNLSSDSKARIFINFNFRYSDLYKFISSSIANGAIGNVINITGVLSHGLAFKEGYPNSWRGKYSANKSVVLDTSLIHLIDLFNYVFDGALEISFCSSASFKHGLDSFSIGLKTQNKVNISLFSSYAAPYCFSMQIIGTDGIIEASHSSLIIKAPRDTFDDKGFFISPPKSVSQKYSFELDYQKSLQSAVNYFISHAVSNKSFSIDDFDHSLATTKLVFDAQMSSF